MIDVSGREQRAFYAQFIVSYNLYLINKYNSNMEPKMFYGRGKNVCVREVPSDSDDSLLSEDGIAGKTRFLIFNFTSFFNKYIY